VKRKIAAILSADVAGYSRLVAEDEEETLRRLNAYQGVFQDHISRAGGRIFNTAGDAVLAEFPSAVDAVRCAIDVQESLRTRNLAYPQSRQMAFRMGLTIGDVVEQVGGDLLGDGVNVAARLQTLAKPGGICISKAMYDAVANKLSVRFIDLGAHELKNIPTPVNAYSVQLEDVKSGDDAAAAPSRASPARSYALPLSIVAAMLIGGGVAALTTGFLSGGKSDGPTQVVKTDTVAPESATELTPAAVAETSASPPVANATPVPDAREVTTVEEAKSEEPKVAALPPDRSGDVAGMERLRVTRWRDCKGDDTELALTGCWALIHDAGTSGTDLATAHRQLGYAQRKKGEIDASIESFSKSIEIDDTPQAHNDRGIAYLIKGRSGDAIVDFDRAINLDGSNGEAYNNRAWTNYKAGKFRDALTDANRAVQLVADKGFAWDTRGHIQEALGNRSGAIQDFEKAIVLDPTLETSTKALKRLRGG